MSITICNLTIYRSCYRLLREYSEICEFRLRYKLTRLDDFGASLAHYVWKLWKSLFYTYYGGIDTKIMVDIFP